MVFFLHYFYFTGDVITYSSLQWIICSSDIIVAVDAALYVN